MTNTKETGNKGENLAKDYLIEKGYSIRDCNWHFGHLEIDIIAENNTYVIFCEVKTRSSNTCGNPEEFVSRQQQKNIIRAANVYMNFKNCEKEVRFDILSILQSADIVDIKHIEGAFLPSW